MIGRPKTVQASIKHWTMEAIRFVVNLFCDLNVGAIHVTTAAKSTIETSVLKSSLGRHRRRDWGNVTESQREFNAEVLKGGWGTIHSIYALGRECLHIVTFQCRCNRWKWPAHQTLVCLDNEIAVRTCECVWAGVPLGLVPSRQEVIPARIWASLNAVLAYIWWSEKDAFADAAPNEQTKHVFKDAAIVAEWLDVYGRDLVAGDPEMGEAEIAGMTLH